MIGGLASVSVEPLPQGAGHGIALSFVFDGRKQRPYLQVPIGATPVMLASGLRMLANYLEAGDEAADAIQRAKGPRPSLGGEVSTRSDFQRVNTNLAQAGVRTKPLRHFNYLTDRWETIGVPATEQPALTGEYSGDHPGRQS